MSAAAGVRPPERLTVPEAATKYRTLVTASGNKEKWDNDRTPYLVEPMECLTDQRYSSVCFVGPSQCGKTDMFLNYLTYTVKCDPADLMIVQMSNATARDFSLTRVDRLHRHSAEVRAEMLTRKDADNTFDKQYRSGMFLRMAWPSISELSSRPIPRLWATDYDRMDPDVGGEGSVYQLLLARTTSFGRYSKVVVESSPGFLVENTQWVPKTKHEAPPTQGILQIYNTGDRRRWYWRCVECKFAFEVHPDRFVYPDSEDMAEVRAMTHVCCPRCSAEYYEHRTKKTPSKKEMNQLRRNGGQGTWLRDGQFWNEENEIVGQAAKSSIASFWLTGAAAAFAEWGKIVEEKLNAEKNYEENADENPLKTCINTRYGLPYILKAQAMARMPEMIKARAKDYGTRVVPFGVRFLIGTIDIQKNRFVCQVHGIGEKDIWIVDRFVIKYSRRLQEDAKGQLHYVNAGSHPEDWRQLCDEFMNKTYALESDPDQHMGIMHTFCDSGGQEGVTANAYSFVQWLRWGYDDEADPDLVARYPWYGHLAARFQLLKGSGTINIPRVAIHYPDSQRKDRNAGARGEIPVMTINTNVMKDALDNILNRLEEGGRINFPKWLDDNFYKELCVEIKDKKTGKWDNPNKYRNESWDLLVYCLAGLQHPTILWSTIDWDDPPGWAAPWDQNDLVFRKTEEDETPFDFEKDDEEDNKARLARLAEALA